MMMLHGLDMATALGGAAYAAIELNRRSGMVTSTTDLT